MLESKTFDWKEHGPLRLGVQKPACFENGPNWCLDRATYIATYG